MAEKKIKLLLLLEPGERSGRSSRESMNQCGYKMNGTSFYQMCARLEDDGLIEGWYTGKTVNNVKIMQRWHRITDKGRQVLEESRNGVQSV